MENLANRRSMCSCFFQMCLNRSSPCEKHTRHLPTVTFWYLLGRHGVFCLMLFSPIVFISASAYVSSPSPHLSPSARIPKIKYFPCPRPVDDVKWMFCQMPYVCCCVLSCPPPPPQLSSLTFGHQVLPPAIVLITYWQCWELRRLVNRDKLQSTGRTLGLGIWELGFQMPASESSVTDTP